MNVRAAMSIFLWVIFVFPAKANDQFIEVTTGGRIGYIVPKDYNQKEDSGMYDMLQSYRAESEMRKITGFWNPTVQEIATAEKAAWQFLKSTQDNPSVAFPYLKNKSAKDYEKMKKNAQNEVSLVIKNFYHYQCQYVGFIENGKKRIFCNYFDLGTPPIFNLNPSTRFIDVNDGGYNYWQIEYDPDSKICANLQINGPWALDW